MFHIFFGWRKASKCKKLIRRVQCRLKLLKSKRLAITRLLREDIAHLWNNGYQHIAYNRLDQLCIDEDMMTMYQLLDQFCEFIILNLSYIRRHKDLPKDVHEAVSTLIFASVRCGDLPELRLVRKLFEERYGRKITVAAEELHPGNLVNLQVADVLTRQSVSADVRNRLLDEILKDSLFKPGLLALEYNPGSQVQSSKGTELYEVQGKDICVSENRGNDTSTTSCAIVLQSSSVSETPKHAQLHSFALPSTPYNESETRAIEVRKSEQTESSIDHQDSAICLDDDIQEFKSPTKQTYGMDCWDQDQRFFVFTSAMSYDKVNEKIARKRIRWGSESREIQTSEDADCQNCYSYKSDNRRKYQRKQEFYLLDQGSKKLESRCSLHQPCYFYSRNQEVEIQAMDLTQTPLKLDYMDTLLPSKSRAVAPYIRAATMPQCRDMVVKSSAEVSRSRSLTVQMNTSSPKHVHPKLPDYDEITAKFTALKKVHQLNKRTTLKVAAPLISLIFLFTFNFLVSILA